MNTNTDTKIQDEDEDIFLSEHEPMGFDTEPDVPSKYKDIRALVRGLYAIMKLRVAIGNRITTSFKVKLGIPSSTAEKSKKEENELLELIRSEYVRITDEVKKLTMALKSDSKIITTQCELVLINSYEIMLQSEKDHMDALTKEVAKSDIWNEWLVDVHGCGIKMAAVIISEINVHKANSMAALEKYCGVDVVLKRDDNGEFILDNDGNVIGEGRSRKARHLVDKVYTDCENTAIHTKGISFNPFLKTKMVGVLGGSFIKKGGPYRVVYDNYKARLYLNPKHKDKSVGHKHNMAIRYMIKEFLADLWKVWRTIEGLPLKPRYAEAKLGIHHGEPCRVQAWVDNYNRRHPASVSDILENYKLDQQTTG